MAGRAVVVDAAVRVAAAVAATATGLGRAANAEVGMSSHSYFHSSSLTAAAPGRDTGKGRAVGAAGPVAS